MSVLIIFAAISLQISAQPVSDYTYKLDNGITVKTERTWSQVWVQQKYSEMATGDKTSPISVNIRVLGSLISGSEYKLMSGGKEVKLQGVAPGTYDLRLTFKLSGKPGTLSFIVGNILIKPKSKTAVDVTLYDYQVMIDDAPGSLNGMAAYETDIDRCKTHTIQDIYEGIPIFYESGKHDKPLNLAKVESKTRGQIKPGTYDVLISVGISTQTHKVWLENFILKPNTKYKITINLNAGGIQYTGGNKEVSGLHLYPAGTAAKQTGNPAPNKSLETISYDNVAIANCTSPGVYDVLINYGKGKRYEWRKNIAISTGSKSDIK
ncbi:MAG: hypothetical protein A2X05_12660 [Bacteroidetes bacterium GWE2_41_25]|nr:MAG: hypothetical protein A2X03_06230 [Bacteroidetes bacterium GWA2_40_15]OFX90359.1 MAG: hypothetical protein A2X06_18070 [Bacteroidetes bacterium GWC2_40_22]OFY09162.1 MAG: hypothetical protein A2X05_12660 [Bacteroidetes bacterium GWE2_41_25]HAM10576.1 hypothetical protein [Bacteroidales bacterium]HBH84920.1 hypothetical protein [Bacteroidales bacterium]